jgi:hypothetical protein
MKPIEKKLRAMGAGFLPLLGAFSIAFATAATPADAGVGLGARGGVVRDPDDDESMRTMGGLVRFTGGLMGLEVAVDRWTREVGNTEIAMTPVTASLLLYPLPFAYVGAGAGRYGASIDSPGFLGLADDHDASAGYHLSAGLEIPVLPPLRLTGDVRYMFVDRSFEQLGDSSLSDSDVVALQVGALLVLPGN